MANDVAEMIKSGGKGLIDLLNFSVLSVPPEPLFVCLVRDSRAGPTVGPTAGGRFFRSLSRR